MAASNPFLRWDQHHQELWYENMSNPNTSQRWPCPYCGAKNHYPDNCPHSPFRDSLQRSRPPNRRTSRAPICGEFNNGQCTRNACIFQHICFTCKGPHPRISCPDRRPATQKPVRPTSGHGDRSFLSVTKPLIDHCLHSGSQTFNLYSL